MTNDPMFSDSPRAARRDFRRILAWIVIWGCTAIVAVRVFESYREKPRDVTDAFERHSVQLQLAGRYSVGAREVLKDVSPDTAKSLENVANELQRVAPTSVDQVRLIMVVGEMSGADAANQRIAAMLPTVTDPALREDLQALQSIYLDRGAELSAEQRERLRTRHGWFGRLALGFHQPTADPDRQIAVAAGRRSVAAVWTFIGSLGLAAVAGFVLFIIAMVRLADGRVRRAYQRVREPSTPFLEAFALWIGIYLLVSFIARKLSPDVLRHAWVYLLAMLIPPAVGIAWPLFRGVDRATWKQALGWHAGRGVFREIGCGLLGYVMGLPVFAVGFLIMLGLNLFSKANPTHPIIEEMAGSTRTLAAAFVLACIYAPIVEETLFRGAFFHALRCRHGWLVSAVITSFVFASIHPQGWTVVPVLFALAFVFAGIREWRGTILASAAAHALNNGMMLTLLVFLLK